MVRFYKCKWRYNGGAECNKKYLCERIVKQRLVGDEVEESDAVLVERQDVLGALLGLGLPTDREEAGAKERPRRQDLEHLKQNGR